MRTTFDLSCRAVPSDLTCSHVATGLAYVDSMSGLIPCQIIRMFADGDLEVRVTGKVPGYHKGELIIRRADKIIPRGHVRRSGPHHRITDGFKWAAPAS